MEATSVLVQSFVHFVRPDRLRAARVYDPKGTMCVTRGANVKLRGGLPAWIILLLLLARTIAVSIWRMPFYWQTLWCRCSRWPSCSFRSCWIMGSRYFRRLKCSTTPVISSATRRKINRKSRERRSRMKDGEETTLLIHTHQDRA